MAAPKSVDQFIRAAPPEEQPILRKVRSAIRAAAPDAEESISYGLPFYSYEGEVGIERRLCYFRVQQSSLRVYLRPKDLAAYEDEISKFRTSKSALRFALDKPIPLALIKKLVRHAVREHRVGKRS
jgi:uncharacterized protein YdhG (YjbR/CyaY superfamily)